MISPPSILPPVKADAPFDCQKLPCMVKQCQTSQEKYASTVPPDCSRLPPRYQAACRALPPPCAGSTGGCPSPLDASTLPGWTGPAGDALRRARNRCGNLATGSREFYSCLWAETKYPAYPEFGNVLITETPPVPSGVWPRQPCPDNGTLENTWKPVSENFTYGQTWTARKQ